MIGSNTSQNISIFCELCKGYLISSVTVKCGHVFCSFCLQEYFLLAASCPSCSKPVRQFQRQNNIVLDKIVTEYLKRFHEKEYQIYKHKLQLQKEYKKKRQYYQNQHNFKDICAGQVIDVRDHNYIWHKARVIRTFFKYTTGRVKFIKVRYLQSDVEQELDQHSRKIAPEGFFTNRTTIPREEKGLIVVKQQGQSYLFESH